MKSLLYVLALGLVAAVAVWAYQVNYRTLDAQDRVAALRDDILREREAIAILRAEWARLNAPDRLSRLSLLKSEELGLRPMSPESFAETAMVAFPPPPPLPPAPPYSAPPIVIENNVIAALDGVREMFGWGGGRGAAAGAEWTLALGAGGADDGDYAGGSPEAGEYRAADPFAQGLLTGVALEPRR